MKILDNIKNLFSNPLFEDYEKRATPFTPATGIRHPFHNVMAILGVLIIYEILILFFHTSQVVKFQGGDIWFLLYKWVPFHTLPISLVIIIYLTVVYLRKDYLGVKTDFEQKIDELLKAKNLPPFPKNRMRFNYLFGLRMLMEALFFAGLMYAILPHLTGYLLETLFPNENLVPPRPQQLIDYQTNVMQNLAIAFGSGFYEETIFRYYLLGWMNGKMKQYFPPKDTLLGYLPVPDSQKDFRRKFMAVFVTALIYSFSHFLIIPIINPNAEVFTAYQHFKNKKFQEINALNR